jgi:hypothetical protein
LIREGARPAGQPSHLNTAEMLAGRRSNRAVAVIVMIKHYEILDTKVTGPRHFLVMCIENREVMSSHASKADAHAAIERYLAADKKRDNKSSPGGGR